MDYITIMNVRTQSFRVVSILKKGGIIKPKKQPKTLTKMDINQLKKLVEKLNLPKTSYEERKKIYRKHLLEKYGKNLS